MRDHPHAAELEADLDYAGIFAATPTPFLVLTPELVIREANSAYLLTTARERDELVGRHLFEAFPESPGDLDGEGRHNLRVSLERVLATGLPDTMSVQRFDIAVPAGNGSREFVERYWSTVNTPVPGENGSPALVIHRVEDVTDFVRHQRPTNPGHERTATVETELFARGRELEALNRRLQALNGELHVVNNELLETRDQLAARARHDPLTGLLVRSVFLEEVAHALSRLVRHPGLVAVLFVDLDRLKFVNDHYGHAAGDELIRFSAERLRTSVRPSDSVARIGGDEFVVLLEGLHDAGEADVIASRVLASLGTSCRLGTGLLIQPSASIGVAISDTPQMGADTLISHADSAMYRAKQSGRGHYQLFDEDAYAAANARHQLETELRTALPDSQLLLHYQPIIDLNSGDTHAVEALLRWVHPTRGLIPAGDFIAVAEDSRLILDIGIWVIRQACQQLAEWDAHLGERAPARMFVNLSVTELAQPQFDQRVTATLAATGVAPHRLVLEITESGMLHEPQTVRGGIDGLLELGCQLAIDDFGTGYSSLSRLMHLPADTLKIDQSFIRNLHRDHESVAVVSAVLLLAHNLRKSVVAEGVEDALTLQALKDLGCQYAQGFHLAHPQPAADLTRRLSLIRS